MKITISAKAGGEKFESSTSSPSPKGENAGQAVNFAIIQAVNAQCNNAGKVAIESMTITVEA